MEPAAIDVPMKPHADAPPSWSRATMGPATRNAAKAKFQTACAPRLRRYQRRAVPGRSRGRGWRGKLCLSVAVGCRGFGSGADCAPGAKGAESVGKVRAGLRSEGGNART